MRTSLLSLLTGVAVGAGGTYYLLRDPPPRPEGFGGGPARIADPDALRSDARVAGLGTAERAAVYASAAAADARGLARLLEEAVAIDDRSVREFTLAVVLGRFAELDPERGLAAARALGLRERELTSLYTRWAAIDLDAALERIGTLARTEGAHEIALAVLDVLGAGPANTERVLAGLHSAEPTMFRIDAIERDAARRPQRAFDRAMALDNGGARAEALRRVARSWAEQDVAAALAAARRLESVGAQDAFVSELFRHVTAADVEAVFGYLADVVRSPDQERAMLTVMQTSIFAVARIDPERTLELAETLPVGLARQMREIAFGALANDDPAAAIAAAGALPSRLERDAMLAVAARAYGAADPDGALAWLRGLDPAAADKVRTEVHLGVAGSDPLRGLELALDAAGPDGLERRTRLTLMTRLGGFARDRPDIADRLRAIPPARGGPEMLSEFVGSWASTDLEGALAWMSQNVDTIDTSLFSAAAAGYARRDPALAADMTGRVPSAARAEWIATVAPSYARVDADAALSWVAQYRGTPGYERALLGIARTIRHFDPPAAAELLNGLAGVPGTAEAAAEVAQTWSSVDAGAARIWIASLAAGATRDRALAALIENAPISRFDESELDAIGSAALRAEVAANLVPRLADTMPGRARALVERHVSDVGERRRLLERIGRAAAE